MDEKSKALIKDTITDEKHYGIIIGSKYYAYVKLENVSSMCKHCDLAELCSQNPICGIISKGIPFKDNRYMCFKYVGDIAEIKLKQS